MREAASDVWLIPHERAATKQTAGKAAAHSGFDEMAPPAALLALRICTSYSTRLAPCIRGHLVRNAAHEGFCISLPAAYGQRMIPRPGVSRNSAMIPSAGTLLASAAIATRASSSESLLRYSALYARRTAAISLAANPRRRRPSLLVPCGFAGYPDAVTNGGTSCSTIDPAATMACAPMRQNWCTPTNPPSTA